MNIDRQIKYWAKLINEDMEDEAMSLDDILKHRGSVSTPEKKTVSLIEEVWVKKYPTSPEDDSKIVYELKFDDGRKFEDTTSATETDDKQFKQVRRELNRGREDGKATYADIQIAILKQDLRSTGAKWFFGPDRKSDVNWAYQQEIQNKIEDDREEGLRFMDAWLAARDGGSSDPWGDAEIATGRRDVSDFADYRDDYYESMEEDGQKYHL